MRAVIQRVTSASVVVDNELISSINEGLMVLLGISHDDTENDIEWLAKKIANLRIFDDENGIMNVSLLEKKGEILIISQFTLHASTKKGNRPSYINAARPEIAEPLYLKFLHHLEKEFKLKTKAGIFGADMQVNLTNTGPVTIIIDTKIRE